MSIPETDTCVVRPAVTHVWTQAPRAGKGNISPFHAPSALAYERGSQFENYPSILTYLPTYMHLCVRDLNSSFVLSLTVSCRGGDPVSQQQQQGQEQESLLSRETEEHSDRIVPQLKIGEDGNIVLDEGR